jgi:tetratricopeptide (TPR) repeat protein
MKVSKKLRMTIALCASVLAFGLTGPAFGQGHGGGGGGGTGGVGGAGSPNGGKNDPTPDNGPIQPPVPGLGDVGKVDPAEDNDYKALAAVKATDYDQQIALGEAFVSKYVASRYREAVYADLMHAYFEKQEFPKMYENGDKALAINPDDVSVLVQLGWVTPHNYDPNDIDAAKKLEKAEAELTHGLEVLATLPKPATMTDEVFTKSKASATEQAHSGLGLVYFREQKPAESAAELEISTKGPNADPADLYVLGRDYEALKKYSEASGAYTNCAAITGPLQSRCKQRADQTKQQAAAQPAAKP